MGKCITIWLKSVKTVYLGFFLAQVSASESHTRSSLEAPSNDHVSNLHVNDGLLSLYKVAYSTPAWRGGGNSCLFTHAAHISIYFSVSFSSCCGEVYYYPLPLGPVTCSTLSVETRVALSR